MRHRSGYMLVAALAVLCALFTVALALHYMAGTAHAAYMMNEAQSEAEQSLSEQLALKGAELQKIDPPPAAAGHEVSSSAASDSRLDAFPERCGSEVFGAAGKKGEGFSRAAGYYDAATTKALGDYTVAPWNTLMGFVPKTWRADLRVFGRRRYVAHYTHASPFGAYAPEGSVTLTEASAWCNPVFGQDVGPDPTQARSGLPVQVFAHGDVTVSDAYPYGEVWSTQGTVKLPKGAGVVAFRGAPPTRAGGVDAYGLRLRQTIEDAFSALDGATQAGNKTAILNSKLDIDDVVKIFTGSTSALRNNLSLRNAMGFPLPMIPGFASAPPYYRLIFHMPYAPDFAKNGAKNDGSQIPSVDSKGITDKIDDARKALDKAKQELIDAVVPDVIKDLEKKVDDLQNQLNNLIDQFKKQVEDAKNSMFDMQFGDSDGPPTRHAEDDSGITDDGDKGYAYAAVAKSLWGLLEGMVDAIGGGGLGAFMKQVTHDVRLIYFGRRDDVAELQVGDGSMDLKATLSVPRGRTLRIDSSVKIRGDVWVGRGAALHVLGNLEVAAPKAPGDDPMAPSGRLFLEEGASIVVSGNLTCGGSSRFGSVIVCGPILAVHPITSALLVKGTVTIPYGIYAGGVLDELTTRLVGVSSLQTALDELAPNVSKLAGPFHRRKPYLASWATVIGIVTPVPFVGFVAFPEPSQTPNMLVSIFRALSMIYTYALNETLGENLYTHCDWWIFGDGVVPVVPKLAPDALKTVVNQIASSFPSLATNVASMVAGYIAQMVTEMLGTVLQKVVEQLIGQAMQAIPYGSLIAAAVSTALNELKQALLDKVTEAEKQALAAAGGLDQAGAEGIEAGVVASLKNEVNKALDAGLLAALLRECSGVLVYGRNGVKVAVGGGCPLATGMFVSDADVEVGTDYVVGSLVSLHGRVTAKRLLYYPYFTRASVCVPREPSFDGDWLKKGVDQVTYGGAMYGANETPDAVDVGPPVARMTAGGWDQ